MQNRVFVDTAGWANLFVGSEPLHRQAREWFMNARQQGMEMVTTNYVVAEFVALLYSPLRVFPPKLFQYVDGIKTASYVNLGYIDVVIDDSAWSLLKSREDKEWSLVDATSFIVMQNLGIVEALTTDHHFEQAGFVQLLRT